MDILRKVARSVRDLNGESSLQSFYGAIARRHPDGGPQYRESKRDYDALNSANNRYMIF